MPMASTYTVERTRTIRATPDQIRPLVSNFRNWRLWSPWEEVDKDLHRAYSGAHAGIGAHYAWSGNRKAGAGSMEITAMDEERVVIDLEFLKPFKASNVTTFRLEPADDDRTRVTWQMQGARPLLVRLLGPLMNMDKLVGGDFEKGLDRLDEAARRSAADTAEGSP